MTPPALHPMGHFRDPDVEHAFQQQRFAPSLQRAQVMVVVVALISSGTIVTDYLFQPELALALLPNRLAVILIAAWLFGPLRPTETTGVAIRITGCFVVYATGLAGQQYITDTPGRIALIWMMMAIFGVSLLRVIPLAWRTLLHLYTIAVLVFAVALGGRIYEIAGMEIVSVVAVAMLWVYLGRGEEVRDRALMVQTWRATALAESKEALLAAVAHELRTPLASARMAVGVAQANPARRDAMLERVDLRLQGLSELIDGVLSLEVRSTETMQRIVDLGQLLSEIAADLRQLHPGLTIESNGATELFGDPVLLRAALLGIASNGARFASNRLVLSATEDKVRIEDDGPGIPSQDRERIFEPLVRLQPRADPHQGHGLGLAIAKRILTLHHAELSIDEGDLGGARFTITLSRGNASESIHSRYSRSPSSLP